MKIGKDLVTFITGGASGLGAATARRLVSLGSRVAIADLNEAKLEAMKVAHPDILTFRCDVSKEADVKRAMEDTANSFGGIHAAVACAGVFKLTPMLAFDTAVMNQVIGINLFGSVYMAKYAAEIMASQEPITKCGERGAIIFTSSISGTDAEPGTTAYAASKSALNGMVLSMSRDLGQHGIRALSIAPGTFPTSINDTYADELGMSREELAEDVKQAYSKVNPMGRMGRPEEFAHIVGACIENSYLNACTIRLDGGSRLSYTVDAEE